MSMIHFLSHYDPTAYHLLPVIIHPSVIVLFLGGWLLVINCAFISSLKLQVLLWHLQSFLLGKGQLVFS
jgi:hypothetical protein